jgi:ABC-2 type transport system ATP-binding protein
MNPTIEAHDLIRRYGRFRALDGMELVTRPGVTGLLGPNGAGKTTLLRVLATVTSYDEGHLRVLGRDPRDPAGRLAIRRSLGYLPQDAGFHPGFTAFEAVDYVAVLKEHTRPRARHDEVRRVLDLVGLGDAATKKVRALSGGMRRRLGLAQALLGTPDLLVLDEPTVGLDPEQRIRFRDLVSEAGHGRTVVLSTHQTEDVAALCSHVVVAHRGRSLFAGSVEELTGVAQGRVWVDDHRDPRAYAAWRLAGGAYHHVGDPPSGAELVPPRIEDAYLLLLGPDAGMEGAA